MLYPYGNSKPVSYKVWLLIDEYLDDHGGDEQNFRNNNDNQLSPVAIDVVLAYYKEYKDDVDLELDAHRERVNAG